MSKKSILSKTPDLQIDPLSGENNKPAKSSVAEIVAGHKLTQKHLDIFDYFHSTHSGKLTCEHFGFTTYYLSKLKAKPWWKQLELETISLWHSQMQNKFMSHENELFEAYLRVLRGGENLGAGVANSIMKAMELYLKSSPLGIRATLVPRADVNIEVKEEVNLNINISAEKVKLLTPSQVSDWVKSGVLPAEITESDIVDTEYEEIE